MKKKIVKLLLNLGKNYKTTNLFQVNFTSGFFLPPGSGAASGSIWMGIQDPDPQF